MKKILSILAMAAFTATFAQEAPKKSCCAGKDAKECKMGEKKTAKNCDMTHHKDCKIDHSKEKKQAKKIA